MAFSLTYADAAASLPLKPKSASLPKPVSFSLLHAKLGLPPHQARALSSLLDYVLRLYVLVYTFIS